MKIRIVDPDVEVLVPDRFELGADRVHGENSALGVHCLLFR